MHLSLTPLVVLLFCVTVAPVYGVHKARRFRIDLETQPEERWERVLHQYDIEKFRKLAKEVIDLAFVCYKENALPSNKLTVTIFQDDLDLEGEDTPFGSIHNMFDSLLKAGKQVYSMVMLFVHVWVTFIPKVLVPSLNALISPLDEFIPEPYAAEIKGIAKTSGLGIGEVLGLNIVYDVTAFCTSIVAEDTQGNIFHARNLDYKVTGELKNLTSIVTYYRHGVPEYTTTSFLGQVGAFTGMKPHEFTVSLNERNQGSVEKNLEALFESLLLKRGTLTSFIIRDVIATKGDYQEAIASLSETPLVAPAYLIVGGVRPGEGVVITRDQKHADLWQLDVKSGRWWLLETNYDHWEDPPTHDDRRDPGNKAMMKVGQANINERTLFEVLSVHPVLNDITAYTNLMAAARPELYDAIIRD